MIFALLYKRLDAGRRQGRRKTGTKNTAARAPKPAHRQRQEHLDYYTPPPSADANLNVRARSSRMAAYGVWRRLRLFCTPTPTSTEWPRVPRASYTLYAGPPQRQWKLIRQQNPDGRRPPLWFVGVYRTAFARAHHR